MTNPATQITVIKRDAWTSSVFLGDNFAGLVLRMANGFAITKGEAGNCGADRFASVHAAAIACAA